MEYTLFVIGNGFDLAHGLKTNYTDFIHDYVKRLINENLAGKSFYDISSLSKPFEDKMLILSLVPNPRNDRRNYLLLNKIPEVKTSSFWELQEFLKSELPELQIDFNHKGKPFLIEKPFDKFWTWSDVENNYYRYLSLLRKRYTQEFYQKDIDPIIRLITQANEFIQDFTFEFKKYLNTLKPAIKNVKIPAFEEIFASNLFRANQNQHSNYGVLNFNYTNTSLKYLKAIHNEELLPPDIFNIHGSIHGRDEDILLGFGDERSRLYKELVELNEKEFLRFVKSFYYLKNEEYKSLMGKLNIVTNLRIVVLGHSCSMSDRTLMYEVINRRDMDNTRPLYQKKVLLYTFGKTEKKQLEDYSNKLYGLSTYFDDNIQMRNHVEKFDSKLKIPQMGNSN